MTDAPVTREEFHMLRAALADQARRIEQTQTTANGIATLSVQLTEVIKDVTDARRELADHERRHDKEAASRLSARRWAAGAAIGALASLWAPLVYLISHIR